MRTTETFTNEPHTDFSQPAHRQAFQEALRKAEAEAGREIDLVIGGERAKTAARFPSKNPANPSQVVGQIAKASRQDLERAFVAAEKAFAAWSKAPATERAEVLFRAADIMRRRKHEMSATMVLEVGKSWPEADGDTAEAIDFMDFYAREALRYGGPQPVTPVPGEKNQLVYIPLGVGVVIPPWNFPLAILCGMTSAAVVTGNTVILKPSSDSAVIASKYLEIMEQAGLPPGVINFLPGSGGEIGDPMVQDPRTRFVAFTGSKETGLRIVEGAARTAPGQKWIKRVVAEMGGKDAIIVDAESNLDEAARGVMVSAFGFQGQKCSACSRAIVHEKVYDAFLEKLTAQVKGIKVGDPRDPATFMGPVVNASSRDTILRYIEAGKKEGRVVAGGKAMPGEGYFVEPTVIADVPPGAVIEQEEIFGPVLAVIKARDYDHALEIANDTEFGLTGGVYSNNKEHLERARREFHVGNLYLNRQCTGAMVGGHPFGGFNMSGTDSKAGGRDYLLLFLQAKVVAEKAG